MKTKLLVPALAASVAFGGLALAGAASAQSRAGSYGYGAAEADRRGAYADADVGSKARGHRGRRGESANSASTFGTGAIYTDRRRAAAAASTGGSASGPGSQSASSEVDVYGYTDRQGSEAGAYGASTADSRERRRRGDD